MEATVDIEVFRSDPVGRCHVGDRWIHWCARPRLFGVLLWGRPDQDGVEGLVRSLAIELEPGVAPHQSLVDARALDSVDGGAFEALGAYVRDHRARLSEQVERLALVRPDGLAGAVTAGFFEVLESPYPVAIFDDASAALAWLEPGGDEALVAELEASRASVVGVDPRVARLRAHLVDVIADADIHGAARALGVSERTLQRQLKSAGTTFQAELASVRVAEAKRRMLETDAPLTRIALDLGFASPQHFSAQFRRVAGVTPSQWRRSHRG